MEIEETADYLKPESIHGNIPLVIVQGFLGGGSTWLWGDFERYLNSGQDPARHRRVIFVSIGPVSSLHDRACELYHALVGGTVDYGEAHAKAHHHTRYGRHIVQGSYPDWSPEAPLHFLGHSIGGPTIIKLQHLIRTGHFGHSAHPRMVRSLTTITSPFRGTQSAYLLGERSDAAPFVRPLSVGSFIGKAVHVLSFLAPVIPASLSLDLHGDCRSLTYRDISVLDLLKQLWRSDWAESEDVAPFDVTFQASDTREEKGEGSVESETYYKSFVYCMTKPRRRRLILGSHSRMHTPSLQHLITSPLSYLLSLRMGMFDFSTLKPRPSFLRDAGPLQLGEEYWANDGVVPLFSQWHPLPCSRTSCSHRLLSKGARVQPGTWYVKEAEGHHLSVVPLWLGTETQREFWLEVGEWLRTVEMQI